MAVYQYKVKKTDTLPQLAEQFKTTPLAILQQNQITNLSAGTVIKLPNNANPVGIGENYAGSSNYLGGQVNNPPHIYPTLGTPNVFPVNPNYSTSGNATVFPINPNYSTSGQMPTAVVTPQPAAPAGSVRPTGVYTGDPINNPNDKAWVDYWNYSAQHPEQNDNPPIVMTHDQIWNMKAAQRRRRMAEQAADKPKQPAYQPFFTQSVSFNVGK